MADSPDTRCRNPVRSSPHGGGGRHRSSEQLLRRPAPSRSRLSPRHIAAKRPGPATLAAGFFLDLLRCTALAASRPHAHHRSPGVPASSRSVCSASAARSTRLRRGLPDPSLPQRAGEDLNPALPSSPSGWCRPGPTSMRRCPRHSVYGDIPDGRQLHGPLSFACGSSFGPPRLRYPVSSRGPRTIQGLPERASVVVSRQSRPTA